MCVYVHMHMCNCILTMKCSRWLPVAYLHLLQPTEQEEEVGCGLAARLAPLVDDAVMER